MPDPSQFSVNERNGEFFAKVEVRGSFRLRINAESLEDAEKKAGAEIALFEADPFDIQLDEADEIRLGTVKPEPKMYRVWDGDRKCQVSRLTDIHTPRVPDENGF